MQHTQKHVPRAPAGKKLKNYHQLSILPPVSAPGSPTSSNNTSTELADGDSPEEHSDEHDFAAAAKLVRGLASPETDVDLPILSGPLDENDEADNGSDSDSSLDSTTIYLPQFSNNKPTPKSVQPPKKLNLPKKNNQSNDNADESDSELSVISDNALNELEASIVGMPGAARQGSVGEYNDQELSALLSEDESSIADADESDSEESLSEFDDDDGDGDDGDESSIEEREEQAIVEEVERSGELEHRVGYDSEAESSESDVSFSLDDFFDNRPTPSKHISSTPSKNQSDNEFFAYFGTSDVESDQEAQLNDYSANALAVALEDSDYSDDETDEDNSLPRVKAAKPQTKPTEILSSSTSTSRPPVLGSWVMSSERPYGIIDGLTTRTLSPPAESNKGQFVTPSKRAISAVHSDSDASELALEDFIYTSELDEAEDLGVYSTSFENHGGVVNKDIPLSAFRNRSSSIAAQQQFPVLSFQASPLHRRSSSSAAKQRGKSLSEHGRRTSEDMSLTPSKGLPRRMRKKRRHSVNQRWAHIDSSAALSGRGSPRGSSAVHAEYSDEMSGEVLEELASMGALSPLFGGLA